MANENKNKTSSGVIKTMQHDLERVKNPSQTSFTPDAPVSQPPVEAPQPEPQAGPLAAELTETKVPLEATPQEEKVEVPEMNEVQEEVKPEVNLQLEDPKLEKLLEPEEELSLPKTPSQEVVIEAKPEASAPKQESTPELSSEDKAQDISSAVSSLRQELPKVDSENGETKSETKVEVKDDIGSQIGDSLAKLKGFGTEMEGEDNFASVGSQGASFGQPQSASVNSPTTPPRSSNPYTRINDIRTKDDNFSVEDTSPEVAPTNAGKKNGILIALVVTLIVVVGGGGYWYLTTNQDSEQDSMTDSAADGGSTISENEIDTLVDPLQPDTIVQVTPTANIRADIISAVSGLDSETELIEIDVVDDTQSKVSIEEIQSQLTITIPTQIAESLDDYMLVAVNDNGSFELGLALELQDNLAESYLQTWQSTAIQDLSSFRLAQETPAVPSDATLQSVDITQISTGEVFTNYFYNYNDAGQSTDITAKDNIILVGTTQGTMSYLIQNVFIQ